MAIAIVITLSATGDSGPAGVPSPSATDRAQGLASRAIGPEQCPSARRAVRFYQRRYKGHRAKMGTGVVILRRLAPCPRYLASVWQRKSQAARLAYQRWRAFHFHWWKWLPDKWARIGACETGYGRKPGQWTWNSGRFQGAFGFYYGTWDQYKPRGAPSEAYLATPRQQYQAALNVYAHHGYGAWGCGGA